MKKLLTILFVSLIIPSIAFALTLEQAKQQHLLGETPSGYLGAPKAPSGEVQALMNEINGKRKAKYQSIAKKNGTSLSAVEALAGKKAIKKTPAGQMVQGADGSWGKK